MFHTDMVAGVNQSVESADFIFKITSSLSLTLSIELSGFFLLDSQEHLENTKNTNNIVGKLVFKKSRLFIFLVLFFIL